LKTESFENVKDQIGFCGIWCGSCLGGNGAIQELARRFEIIAKNPALAKWVPKEFDFKEFMKGLACIQAMPVCSGCQKDGGPQTCKIRICARDKGMADCSQCNELMECKNFEQLEKNYPHIKEDLMEIKNKGQAELIKKWMGGLRNKWPHCVLLCTSTKEQ